MVNPIQGGDSSPVHSKSQDQNHEISELQWEINLIGTYLAVSHKGSDLSHQAGRLKKDLEGGKSPQELVPQTNQLIDQINETISSDIASFPNFELTTSGNEHGAMAQHAVTLEKFLNVAAEHKQLPWDKQEILFNQTRTLIDHIGVIPLDEAKKDLNSIINQANQALPPSYQINPIRLV